MELLNKEWKIFQIQDIFIVSGTITTKPEELIPEGNTPRVTCSSVNYGFDNVYQNKPTEKGNVLTIDSATVGAVFYQPYDFIATDHVEKLTPKYPYFNRYIGLFLQVAITKGTKEKFGYGYKFAQQRILKQKFLLPVDSNGEPNYAFMEAYMKNQEQKLLKKYADYQKNNWEGQVLSKPYGWMDYYVSEKANGLFHIASTKSGIDRNKLVITGKEQFPYITRTDSNNGWDGFVTIQPNVSFDVNNVVTLGLDTQTAFYQPTPFYTGQNIQVLSGSHINKHVALFIIQMLKLQMRSKFNWGGNGATLGRLHKMKIMLPAKSDGTPDYKYMENYMKNIEAKQTQAYLAFKQQNA